MIRRPSWTLAAFIFTLMPCVEANDDLGKSATSGAKNVAHRGITEEAHPSQNVESQTITKKLESAPGSGTITGRILIAKADKEAIPEPTTLIEVGKAPIDETVCAANVPILDETLIVNPKNLGLKNVFIYLQNKPADGKEKAASQSTWPTADKSAKTLVLEVENCTFNPHAMIVTVDKLVTIQNLDSVAQNYKGLPRRNAPFNLMIAPAGDDPASIEVTLFRKPERQPVPIMSVRRRWMSGYQLALDHPYAAVTDADGRFTISDLPPGKHKFTIWHEKRGILYGEYEAEVSPDKTTDLRDIEVRLSQLKKN